MWVAECFFEQRAGVGRLSLPKGERSREPYAEVVRLGHVAPRTPHVLSDRGSRAATQDNCKEGSGQKERT
jgi:hypothetical protein